MGGLEPAELTGASPADLQRRIVSIMFGDAASTVSDVAELRTDVDGIRQSRQLSDQTMLELVGVSAKGAAGQYGVSDITLSIHGGEILGIAGVDGNGQRVLAEVIAGQRRVTSGEIRLEGTSVTGLAVSERQRLGLRYVTDDRLGEGVVGRYSVGLNLVLKRIGDRPYWRRGAIDRPAINATAAGLISDFDIRTPSPDTSIGKLSGGNIQKVLLARELSFEPRVVVFNKPTHGLDVRTIAMVRERIRTLADRGVATIVISTDLDELVDLCDRVAVLFAGRIAGIVLNGPGAETRIGELIVGGESDLAHAAGAPA